MTTATMTTAAAIDTHPLFALATATAAAVRATDPALVVEIEFPTVRDAILVVSEGASARMRIHTRAGLFFLCGDTGDVPRRILDAVRAAVRDAGAGY